MGKLKNYTTTIPAHRTIAEIQQLLMEAGASGVAMEYENGNIKALFFKFNVDGKELPFRYPAKADKAYKILHGDKRVMYGTRGSKQVEERKQNALNVAWRVAKESLECQLAQIQLEQAEPAEIFFGYLSMGKKTIYELSKESKFTAISSGVTP